MRDRINVSVFFFILIGAMCGAMLSLFPAFMLDYLCDTTLLDYPFTFTDWIFTLVPVNAILGALYNASSALLLVDLDTEKPEKRRKRAEKKEGAKKKK